MGADFVVDVRLGASAGGINTILPVMALANGQDMAGLKAMSCSRYWRRRRSAIARRKAKASR
jgi:hypothetical protein